MPQKAIYEAFSKKYGDRVDAECARFFSDSGDRHLIRYEKMMSRQVRIYSTVPAIGYLATLSCEFFGSVLSSFGSVRLSAPIAFRRGVKRMTAIAPDVVFSTHWATNYYVRHMKNPPLSVMYCPDGVCNKLFAYPSDLLLISTPVGYQKALKMKKFNASNLKMVPFLIRNEAFSVTYDKKAARRELGLPEDRFTVLFAEGGYGIGKTKAICKRLFKEHIPLTVIAVCGKNKKLYKYLSSLETPEEIVFKPCGFTEDILKFEAAADLFCGKSGNILAEATFFGDPTVVTKHATLIEEKIADHYVDTVGCAMREFSPKKTAELIKKFSADPALLEPYRRAALAWHENFGAEQAADELWKAIVRRFPELITNDRKQES